MDGIDFYRAFADRMADARTKLRALLADVKVRGDRIAAYGAAAKGATLLNYLDLPAGTIDYVVDLNPHKIGKLMPGVSLAIEPVANLAKTRPQYLLLLAWNFGREIIRQQQGFADAGGRFIMPVPEPRIVIDAEDADTRIERPSL